MNNPERQKDIFDAITGIDDDLIQEAAAPRTRPFPRRLVRIAAIAAVLAILMTALLWPDPNYITGPGILTVHAHGVDEEGKATIESEILEEGVSFTPNIKYDPLINFVQHFPISFHLNPEHYPGMELTFEIQTDAGIFYKNEPYDPALRDMTYAEQLLTTHYGQHFTIGSEQKIYWTPWGFDYNHLKAECERGNHDLLAALKSHNVTNNPSFIDIIIRANDLIVGYCVIEIRRINIDLESPIEEYSFEVLTIVSFPKVDGYWQNVKFKYVEEQIQKIHTERGAPA